MIWDLGGGGKKSRASLVKEDQVKSVERRSNSSLGTNLNQGNQQNQGGNPNPNANSTPNPSNTIQVRATLAPIPNANLVSNIHVKSHYYLAIL